MTLLDCLRRAACFADEGCLCKSAAECRYPETSSRVVDAILRALDSPELSEPTRRELRAVLEESERG